MLQQTTVLDLSRILAGPTATQMLADLGAEVIKIERPGLGDDTRSWGPPYAAVANSEAPQSAYFLGTNRGKKSLAIDLKAPAGRALVRQLAASADVLVENFKTGDMARYDLDYESLRQINPKLIYVSITGFGQTGPRANQAGYDLLMQGMAGLMSITGQPDGEPGAEPMKVGVALVDVLTGLYASTAILAALHARAADGQGRHVDLALYEVCAASLANQASNWLIGGMVPARAGNTHPSIAPYQTFQTADGYIVLAVGNDGQFRKLCTAIGCPELGSDMRFETNSKRVHNRDVLTSVLSEIFIANSRGHWVDLLEPLGVPCGPINTVEDVFADPQALARGLVKTLPHPSLGTVACVANPIRFDGASMTAAEGPPMLGQHTRELLSQRLGLADAEIERLVRAGVVGTWDASQMDKR